MRCLLLSRCYLPRCLCPCARQTQFIFDCRSRRLSPRAVDVLSLGSALRLLSLLWFLCRREGVCARPAAHGARRSRCGWAGVGLRLSSESAWHVGMAYVVYAYVLPCEGVRVGRRCTGGSSSRLQVCRLPLPAPGTGQRPGLVAPASCMLRLLGCLCLWQRPDFREPFIADDGLWRFCQLCRLLPRSSHVCVMTLQSNHGLVRSRGAVISSKRATALRSSQALFRRSCPSSEGLCAR